MEIFHRQTDRGPGGETIAPPWTGNPSGPPSQRWLVSPDKVKSGAPCWSFYTRDQTSENRMKMDKSHSPEVFHFLSKKFLPHGEDFRWIHKSSISMFLSPSSLPCGWVCYFQPPPPSYSSFKPAVNQPISTLQLYSGQFASEHLHQFLFFLVVYLLI